MHSKTPRFLSKNPLISDKTPHLALNRHFVKLTIYVRITTCCHARAVPAYPPDALLLIRIYNWSNTRSYVSGTFCYGFYLIFLTPVRWIVQKKHEVHLQKEHKKEQKILDMIKVSAVHSSMILFRIIVLWIRPSSVVTRDYPGKHGVVGEPIENRFWMRKIDFLPNENKSTHPELEKLLFDRFLDFRKRYTTIPRSRETLLEKAAHC